MSAKLARLIDRRVNVLLITGEKMPMSAQEAWAIFFRTDSVIFIGAAFGLVTFLYPVSSGIYIPWWMKLAGFSIFPLLIPMIYFFQVMAIAVTASRFPNLSVFEPVLLLVTTFFIEIVNHTANPFLFGEEWERWVHTASFGNQVTSTYIILLSLDIMYCHFVLPRLPSPAPSAIDAMNEDPAGNMVQPIPVSEIVPSDGVKTAGAFTALSECEAQQGELNDEFQSVVEIDGCKTAISEIMAIEAEEHYVKIWTADRQIYGRYAFGRLISRMNEAEGFSPRRGVWLSFRNIQVIQKDESGKYNIRPIKGPATVVPRAKTREVSLLIASRRFCGLDEKAKQGLDGCVPMTALSGD